MCIKCLHIHEGIPGKNNPSNIIVSIDLSNPKTVKGFLASFNDFVIATEII